MKNYLLILLFWPGSSYSQELFSYTEPASNMAARSIGIRMNSTFLKEYTGRNNFHLNPEVMWGVSRKIMVHADAYFSNSNRSGIPERENFGFDGASVYFKYRFYSQDEVHSHFRMAVFGRLSTSNMQINQPAIDLHGQNTGYEGGVVATKLINKVAISASTSFLHAGDNGTMQFVFDDKARNALGYTLSIGKLMLPQEYTDYKQTNLNLMIELPGQYDMGLGGSYLDLAPSLQLIFLSRMRLDLGYRFPVAGNLFRTEDRGFLLRLEYNLFNVY